MTQEISDSVEGSKMLTAVQKMYDTFNNMNPDTTLFGLPYFSSDQIKLQLLKAIKIERQNIIDAWWKGREYGIRDDDAKSGEQYYDDTFVKSTWDKSYTKNKNMIFNLDNDEFKKQIEFLLGMEVQLTADEINVLAHCTIGNEWVLKVLDKLGLTIDDIVYERDRDILRGELSKLYK